jgi:hypothetical protein
MRNILLSLHFALGVHRNDFGAEKIPLTPVQDNACGGKSGLRLAKRFPLAVLSD